MTGAAKLEGLSLNQQADLDRLAENDETLAYMIQQQRPITWKNYVGLCWSWEPREEQLDEIGLQIKDLLQEMEK